MSLGSVIHSLVQENAGSSPGLSTTSSNKNRLEIAAPLNWHDSHLHLG